MKKLLILLALLATPLYAQDSLLNDVRAVRATYPASMTRPQVAELLNQVAWDHRNEGWGLLRKGSGNSCPLHDTFISCDILIHKGATDATSIHYDVLQDAENSANPVFNSVGPCVLGPSSGCSMTNFLAPYEPAGDVKPDPGHVDPQPVDSGLESAIRSFIEDVRAAIGRLEANQQQTDNRIVALSELVEVVASRPVGAGQLPAIVFPVYKGSLLGIGVTLKPEGQ